MRCTARSSAPAPACRPSSRSDSPSSLASTSCTSGAARASRAHPRHGGAAAPGGLINPDPDVLENLIQLNVTALTRLASAAAQRFAASRHGAIVNVSSIVALIPELNLGIYAATKSYVLTLSQSLQSELGPSGVYVQAVLPPATRTEIWERSGRSIDDLKIAMDADELVDAALVGFDRREVVTIPSLPDVAQWNAFDAARQAMLPNLPQAHAATRYQA